jgi:hypothetical protein
MGQITANFRIHPQVATSLYSTTFVYESLNYCNEKTSYRAAGNVN